MNTKEVCAVIADCYRQTCAGCEYAPVGHALTTPPRQPFATLPMPEEPRKSVLVIAEELIHGDRAKAHGPAEETYSVAATIVNEMLDVDEINFMMRTQGVNASIIMKMMIATKLARASFNPGNRDNLIDAAGYIGLLDELKAA